MLGEKLNVSAADQIRLGGFVVAGVMLWPKMGKVMPVSPTLTLIESEAASKAMSVSYVGGGS